ncbi:MAG: lytic transglycosylase domain-containing protein [Ferruginibacter sp.]
MNKYSFAAFLLLFTFAAIASPAVAGPGSDTSKKNTAFAPVKKNTPDPCKKAVAEANIVFPVLFEDDAEKSLTYIEKFSASRKAYLVRMYNRSRQFFPKVQAILKKYDVPAEFAVLLALESAFNPNAVSKAGAVGYWQIMDDVAKEYGLKIVEDQHKLKTQKALKAAAKTTKGTAKAGSKKARPKLVADDRKNFVKSTHTAARYLKARMRNLDNNWLLIAASYNWGVGNVWDAMAASGKKNPSYWDIEHRLPAETKAYVMNFITLNVIFKNYDKFKAGSLIFKDKEMEDMVKKG